MSLFDICYCIPHIYFYFELTPCNRVLLKKLIVTQLVKKFPDFYGTLSFISLFTKPATYTCHKTNPVLNLPPCFSKIHYNIVSHLRVGLPSTLFLSGFPTKILYTSAFFRLYMPRPSHISRFYHPHNIWCRVQVTKFIMQFSPATCYFLILRSKYSPQHPIFRRTQSFFFPYFGRPSFALRQTRTFFSIFK
jgi:hypothetical protein